MALIFCTGFETRDLDPWDSVTSNRPVVTTSVKRNGGASLGFATLGSCRVGKDVPGTTVLVGRVAVMMQTPPAGSSANVVSVATVAGGSLSIRVTTGGQLRGQSQPPSPGTNGADINFGAMTAGHWYVVDYRMDVSTTSWTLEWRVDGVAQTTSTGAATASTTLTTAYVGVSVSTITAIDQYVDDVAFSSTSGDYPIGDGYVLGYQPNVVGTHNLSAGEFDDDAAGAITSGDTTSYTKIAYKPVDTTKWVEQIAAAAAHYLEYGFEDSSESAAPTAVMAVTKFGQGGTGVQAVEARIRDGSSESTVFSGDPAEGAAPKLIMNTKPSGGAWTLAALNALKLRFGYSTDATPPIRLYGAILEANYQASGGSTTIQISASDSAVGSDGIGQPTQVVPGGSTAWGESAL